MLAKRIIPCLDVKDGRVVKGVSFVNLRDAGDPVENALFYDAQGADELIFLDITASHEKRKIILDVVAKTAEDVFMPLTVGGGIKSLDDIRDLLRAGCDKVSINTTAVKDPHFVSRAAEKFGSQCIVVAIDAKRVADNMAEATGEDWFSDESLNNVILELPSSPVPAGRWGRMGHINAWRQKDEAHKRCCLGKKDGASRGRRVHAHQYGQRRHKGRVRYRIDAHHIRGGLCPCHCIGRSRESGTPLPGTC